MLLTDVDASDKPPMRYGDQALLASRLNRVADPDRGQLVDLGGTYRSAIAAAQTSDHAIATAAAPQPRSWGWVRDVLLVLLLAPFALFGLFVAAIPLLLVLIASKLLIAPAVRATIVPGLAVLLFGLEWVLFAIEVGNDLGGEAALAAVALFPFFVGALFLAVEKVNLLWDQWRRRRRPSPDELPQLQALRGELGEKAWVEL